VCACVCVCVCAYAEEPMPAVGLVMSGRARQAGQGGGLSVRNFTAARQEGGEPIASLSPRG
jgi:hypothetical protein